MTDDQPDVRPEDALQVAQRALAKVNGLEDELAEKDDRLDDLEEQLTSMRLRLSEHDEDRAYHERTLDEKVGLVREHAFERAANGHGRATLDYDDVMWEVFDGEPSPSHCYKLLKLAAGLKSADEDRPTGGEIPGFRCRDPDSGNYHLAVDAEDAKRGAAFYSENKASAEGGR